MKNSHFHYLSLKYWLEWHFGLNWHINLSNINKFFQIGQLFKPTMRNHDIRVQLYADVIPSHIKQYIDTKWSLTLSEQLCISMYDLWSSVFIIRKLTQRKNLNQPGWIICLEFSFRLPFCFLIVFLSLIVINSQIQSTAVKWPQMSFSLSHCARS